MRLVERCTDGWLFWCPGCGEPHRFSDGWAFSGTPESPTFQPSLAVLGFNPDGSRGPNRCHLFVTAGRIQYQQDCVHLLAGKTVPMETVDRFTS